MIGWIRRRVDTAIDRQADKILTALGDGHAHYVAGDLDRLTGMNASGMYPALARLEVNGRIESGWADTGGGRGRRWYRLAKVAS
jgi:DNA-binding PadR family transcriptional regulator